MRADGAGNDGVRRPIAFISHHSSQVETARQLKQVLANNGVDGWMAPDDIDPGRPFDQAIIEQVRTSDLIILLFCSRSDQSRHVKRELMMAENGDKLIFPVRLENIDADGLAYWLNDYQWIDWFDRRDDTIQRMIDTIKRLVQINTVEEELGPPPVSTQPPPVPIPVDAPPPDEADSSAEVGDEPETESAEPATPEPVTPVSEPEADEADAIDARDEAPPAEAKTEAPLKVAPVSAGRSDPEQSDGDGGSPKNPMLLYGALGLAALVAIVLAFLLWPSGEETDSAAGGVLSPTVDCANTDLPSHAIICGSEALRARETELSQRYDAALEQAEGEERVALQQGYAAYQARRDECRTEACITTVYDAREGELSAYALPEDSAPAEGAEQDAIAEPQADTPDSAPANQPDTATPILPPVPERPSQPTRETPSTPEPRSRPTPTPDPPRQSRTTPPQPIGNPSSWVRASDYPANILRNGEEGTSRFQVRVGANGIPTACFTIGSSGHFQLDARACNMVMSRARFRPARDASGNPTAGLYSGSHRWRAPR
ncbi:TIR domain-containing protein [Parasphingopyxis sp.]|uniref:TIR domain-containing protein n=1 Tax=Parasphingopyxis sp. TaxID=1920299 RepID=UPI002626390D|nr:TIR domain-containing protein [Parasphingopyxis sp.]